MSPHVRRLVGLSKFRKSFGSYTSKLISTHFFIIGLKSVYSIETFFGNNLPRLGFDLGLSSRAAVDFNAALSAKFFFIFRPAGNRDRRAIIKTAFPEIKTVLLEIESDLPEIEILFSKVKNYYQPNEGLIV